VSQKSLQVGVSFVYPLGFELTGNSDINSANKKCTYARVLAQIADYYKNTLYRNKRNFWQKITTKNFHCDVN
jgi:hypothetical protein